MTQVRAIILDEDGNRINAANPLNVAGTFEPGNTTDTKITLDGEAVTIAANQSVKVEPGTSPLATTVTATPATPVAATIANGESLSGEIDLAGRTLFALELPAAFTGTALTFQAARATGGTFQNVYSDSGFEVSVTVAASRMVAIDAAALCLAPFRYLKIRSGTAASPTAEGGARTIYLVAK